MQLVSSPAKNGDLSLLRSDERTTIASQGRHPWQCRIGPPHLVRTCLREGTNPTKVPTGVWGPFPKGMVGLIFWENLASIAKESVIPGGIDNDYTGEITILMTGKGLHTFPPKTKTAQLLLPYWVPRTLSIERGDQGFGSTGTKGIYWNQSIFLEQPMVKVNIQEKLFIGLIDTGADITIIRATDWPDKWPKSPSNNSVVTIGICNQSYQSSSILTCKNSENSLIASH